MKKETKIVCLSWLRQSELSTFFRMFVRSAFCTHFLCSRSDNIRWTRTTDTKAKQEKKRIFSVFWLLLVRLFLYEFNMFTYKIWPIQQNIKDRPRQRRSPSSAIWFFEWFDSPTATELEPSKCLLPLVTKCIQNAHVLMTFHMRKKTNNVHEDSLDACRDRAVQVATLQIQNIPTDRQIDWWI